MQRELGDPEKVQYWWSYETSLPWIEIINLKLYEKSSLRVTKVSSPCLIDLCSLILENLLKQQDVLQRIHFLSSLCSAKKSLWGVPFNEDNQWRWWFRHWERTRGRKELLTVTQPNTETTDLQSWKRPKTDLFTDEKTDAHIVGPHIINCGIN